MSLAHSPRIITDGLVLCLDAGNTKSYPGSGTTWTDLSGQGNNGTLVNGVGYNGSNGGVYLESTGKEHDSEHRGITEYMSIGNKELAIVVAKRILELYGV